MKKQAMNKLFFSLILLLVFIDSKGQAHKTFSNENIEIGFSFSPDYCGWQLNKHQSQSSEFVGMTEKYSFDKNYLGFSGGLNIIQKINKSFFVETGILYSKKGEIVTLEERNINPRYGFVYGDGYGFPYSEETTYNYHYLNVPLKINYYFISQRNSIFLSGGVSGDVFLNQINSMKLVYEDGTREIKNENEKTLRRINLTALFGFGFHYKLSDLFSLRFEPMFRYTINKIGNNKVSPYSVGINFGIFYQLKK